MFNDKFKKMIEKKQGGKMSDAAKKAKMSVLHDLKGQADEAMGDGLKGLKKVTVASDSPSGLKHGLDKAKEIVGGSMFDDKSPEEESHESPEEAKSEGDMMESPEHEASESPEFEKGESEGIKEEIAQMDEEEVNQALKELMDRKKQLEESK
jgi:hypothetical protein